jgi:hypothetical protein
MSTKTVSMTIASSMVPGLSHAAPGVTRIGEERALG